MNRFKEGGANLEFWAFLGIIFALLFLAIVSSNNIVYDASNPKDTYGNLEVAIQDQFTEIIDLKLTQFIDYINLTDNYSIGDVYINVSTASIPVKNQIICLKEGTAFYQAHIINITNLSLNNYELHMDRPLDFNFTTGGGCSLRDGNWAVDGSVTPKIFKVSPFGLYDNVSWDITRVILTCIGDGISGADPTPDLTSFMVTDPLTYGIVLRSVNGKTKNIFSANDNFHLISEAYDLTFYDASKFGLYGSVLRRTFNGQDKNGVTIRLNAVTNDSFELIVQDDLTDMDECHAVAQGHVVSV